MKGDHTTLLYLMQLNSDISLDQEDLIKFGLKSAHITNSGYVMIQLNKETKLMLHRAILGEVEYFVDHINGNKLDNRKCNLRQATKNQNEHNTPMRATNTSGYKGVSWAKQNKKWQAQITVNSKHKHLGFHTTKEAAARAYNRAALEYHGEFAYLNEIVEVDDGLVI